MEIHQILVSASPGDAVTTAALDLRRLLGRVAPSEIFAGAVDPTLAADVGRLADYAARPGTASGEGLLVYHASVGDEAVCSFLLERRERLVLLNHGAPPPESFLDVDPDFAARLAQGRLELEALRDRVALALAPSAAAAAALAALGYPDVRVSPLPVDLDGLRTVDSDPATEAHLDEHLAGPLVLSVGPLLPHQRPDLLLAAYHVLVTYLVPDAHLALVGPWPSPQYRDAIDAYRLQLNLHRAWMTGPVEAAARATWYRAAAAFVTASEHEGAGLALLEAMAFDVPVVARACGAVPETVAGAGMVLPPGDDPVLLAEATAEVLAGDGVRRSLVAAGARRCAALDPDRARASFLAHLAAVV